MNSDDIKKVQQSMMGDSQSTLTTIDILSSLKAIDHFEGKTDTVASKIAQQELAYLKAGMDAVSENPLLALKVGAGFQGALNVAQLIKERKTEAQYNKMIDQYIGNVKSTNSAVLNAISKPGSIKFDD